MTAQLDIELLTDDLVEAQAAFKTHGLERTRAALRGGAALARLKALLPHGSFTTHVETHGYTARTAQRWMRLHELALRLELTAEDIQERGGIGKVLKELREPAAADDTAPPGRILLSPDDYPERDWLPSSLPMEWDYETIPGEWPVIEPEFDIVEPGKIAIQVDVADDEDGRLLLLITNADGTDARANYPAFAEGDVALFRHIDDYDNFFIGRIQSPEMDWRYISFSLDPFWRMGGEIRVGRKMQVLFFPPESLTIPEAEDEGQDGGDSGEGRNESGATSSAIAADSPEESETGEEPEPAAPVVIIEGRRRLGERGPWRDLGAFVLQADDMYEGATPAPRHLGILIPPPDHHERRPWRIYVRFHPDDPSVEEIEISEGKVAVLVHEPGLPPDGDYLYGVVSELDTSTLTGCSLLGLSTWGAHGVIEAGREARLLIADRANRPFQPQFDPAAPPFPPPKPEIVTVRRCVDCGSTARRGGDRCRPCEGQANPIYEQSRQEVQRLREGHQGLLRQINHLAGQVRDLRKRLAEAEAKSATMAGFDE